MLLPVSSVGWPPIDPSQKNRTFTCRLLVKPPDDQETMEEKQQRVSKYENMQVYTSHGVQAQIIVLVSSIGFSQKHT